MNAQWCGLSENDEAIIRAFANGENPRRSEAIDIYRRYYKAWGPRYGTNIFMDFMSEVDCPVPDLLLRARFRMKILGKPWP